MIDHKLDAKLTIQYDLLLQRQYLDTQMIDNRIIFLINFECCFS